MAKRKQKQNKGGRIKALVRTVLRIVREDPKLLEVENEDRLHQALAMSLEGYGKMENCFNCGRSMEIVERTADMHVALLLICMAREVRRKMAEEDMSFTEANLVHIPKLATTDAIRHQSTIASYLGLIKQPEKAKHTGYWAITSWGWKALRGEPIPRSARYWNKIFLGRSEETITLPEMFRVHSEQVKRAMSLKRKIKADFTSEILLYNPRDWAQYAGYVGKEDEVVV